MSKISIKNLEGKKVEDMEVSDSVFAIPSNNDLLHQVYVAIYANKRTVIAHTKDRSERAGSGKKPWKQKGTGNARAGQVRSPIWRKGGITFGPTNERNFSKNVNKKMKQKAVAVALSEKIRDKSLVVVEDFNLKERKSKEFAKALKNLEVAGKSVLIGFSENETELKLFSRNIEKVKNISTRNLNVYDLLNNQFLVLSKSSIQFLEEKFGK